MTRDTAVGRLIVAVALMWLILTASSPAWAGDRCDAHFPELRAFIESAGHRAIPDEVAARSLADELAIERALWMDDAERNRSRLEAVGATVGIRRLEAIDTELSALFDELESLLVSRAPLDENTAAKLLDCGPGAGSDTEWPIRSTAGPVPTVEPQHRPAVIAEGPPAGYHDEPSGALRSTTKAEPEDVWPDDPNHPVVEEAALLDHDPIAIYNFVLNEIRTEHYSGALKSPAVVLQSKTGNDADQARLLAAMLRASGYPARLAHGVVEYPTDRLTSHFAVADHRALEELLTAMGLAWNPAGGGVAPEAYRVERWWCEVWIPYANFRGIQLDGSGETWAVLDPEFEDLEPVSGRRVLDEMGFDADAFLDAYLAGAHCDQDLSDPPACEHVEAILEDQIDQWLGSTGDPATFDSLTEPPQRLEDELQILPASMPGHIVSVDWVGLEPNIEDQHRIRLVARDGGSILIDETIPLADITGRAATLWYAPATPDDEQIVRAFGYDMWSVPPYLLNVTPLIINREGEIARGSAGAGMGRAIELESTLLSPSGTVTMFVNREISGVPTTLAVSAGTSGYIQGLFDRPSSLEFLAALADLALGTDIMVSSDLAILGAHGLGFTRPSVASLGNEVEVDGSLGLIQSIEWLGLYIDVDVWGPRAAGGAPGILRDWRTLAQLRSSTTEREVFEFYGVTSVSADLALVLAERLGVEVIRIDQSNLASVLPGLPYQPQILAEIEGWVLAGGEALVPAEPVGLLEWTGVGYVLLEPATGEARYQLAGGLSGGSTAEPPDEAQQAFGLDLWPPTRFPVNTDPDAVVAVRKLDGFDGLEGVVGNNAEFDIRVEALDNRGARVASVPITFSSVAGGGQVLDDFGSAFPELEVLTDENGIATAGFRFGTNTDVNPVYALEHPADEHASQVLLNLVDAVGQGIDGFGNAIELPVSEPFWAVAFPDVPATIRRTDTTATHFTGVVAQWSDTMYLAVEDQYGNPVSNVPVSFDVGGIQLDAACSNELPQEDRRNAAVFDNLSHNGVPACGGHPVLGECGGESLAKATSFEGVSAGVIEGNVVAATYTVDVTAGGLGPLSYTYSQNWTLDPDTQGCDTPDRFRVFSNFLTDENGRNVNAAPAGQIFGWPIDFWIEYYEPKPRPGNPPPDPPFYAGGGQWWSVCGNDLGLSISNGGSVAAPELDPSNWSYRTYVTAGLQPGLNEIRALGASFSYCTNGTPLALPLNENVNNVWGIEPEITGFDPEVVVLTPDGLLATPLRINYSIEPPEYVARSVEIEVEDRDQHATTIWPGTSHSGEGSATLPRGEEIELDHTHLASVLVNRSHPAMVRSAEQSLPLFQSIFGETTRLLRVGQELDVVNRTTCAEHDVFGFHLNHAASITLTFVRLTPTGPGNPEIFIDNLVLGAGDHSFTFSPSSATAADFTLLPGSYLFDLVGVSQVTGETEPVQGNAISYFSMRDTLPVGHAMVKGVDLLDGHLVVSREDLAVPGRGVPLSFERSYSSSSAAPGHLGQGWTHNWLARVVETPCTELILIGTEGSGMRFTPDGAGGWKPPRGYHGSLIRDPATDEIDFFTTGGTRYHFLPVTTLGGDPLGEWYLDFVEDTSLNRTTLYYEEGGDGLPRVKRVVEPAGRELVFTYSARIFEYWGGDVLMRVDGPDSLEVHLDYDSRGNLVDVRREGNARVESYDYDIVAFRDVLTGVVNELNGATTTYQYSNEVLGLAGEAADIFLVERLTEPEGGTTQFFYDTVALAADASVLTTWVRDPRETNTSPPAHGSPGPYDTIYTLNRYGSPTDIADPLGHVTSMHWKTDDVVMDSRTDANGAATGFTYDEHGNLLTESVTVTDVDDEDHTYVVVNTYEPPSSFNPLHIKNRVASHIDRNGSTASFGYDTAGRLTDSTITVTDAEGTTVSLITSHTYDPANGDRWTTIDARLNTTTYSYDAHGNLTGSSREVTAHDGTMTTVGSSVLWDVLGRPVHRTDPEGHLTDYGYDTLGRLTSTTHPEVEIDIDSSWRPVEQTIYDDTANTVTMIDGNGHTTVSTFDLQGRLEQIDNAEGGSKIIQYDPAGNKVRESRFFDDSTPRLDTTYFIDQAGRVHRREEPGGRFTTYDYDPVGNVTTETLFENGNSEFLPRVTEHEYDQLNRRIRSVRDPPPGLAATTTLLLDGEGNVLRLTDAEGRQTHHAFDELNRRIATTEPDWRAGEPKRTQFFYDGNGNLKREIRFNQQLEDDGSWTDRDHVRTTVYDEIDRPIVATDAEGHQSKARYDRSGNLVEEIDRRDFETSHVYDALNRRTSTTQHLTDPATRAPWNITTSRIFDAVGNLRYETLPNGNLITHSYDGLDRLLSTIDTIGPIASFAYDARGNRTAETDGKGNTTTHHYDPFDRVVLSQLPRIRDLNYSWDVAGNRIWMSNGRSASTDFHFDALDRQVLVEYPEVDGVRLTSSATHDLVGNQLTATDLNDNTTTFVHDDLNRVTDVHDPLLVGPPAQQYTISTTYDAVGNRVAETDRRGIGSRWVHDSENRPTEAYRNDIGIALTGYDAAGNPEFVTDAKGNITHTVFDERGLEIRIERPEQSLTLLTRDDMGNVVSEVDGENHETLRGFDLRSRVDSESNGKGETTVFHYDFAGNLTRIQRPLGVDWTWTRIYDAGNRLVGILDPLSHQTTYDLDPQNNLRRVIDADNQITHFDYDFLDRLRQTSLPDGVVSVLTYDGNGNLQTATDPNDQTVTSTYDELNRETLRSYSAPYHPVDDVLQTIAFTWDENSNLVDATETYTSGMRLTHHDWDSFDRLDQVTDGFGKLLDYGYDLNGNRISLIDPDGAATGYTYDGLNRLDTVSLPAGAGTADYDWYRNGLLKHVTYPNGTTADYDFDQANRVTTIENADPGGASISFFGYGYDANGNRKNQTEVNGGAEETTTYDYDLNDRLWKVTYPDRTTTYSFDNLGNRSSERSVDLTGNDLVNRGYAYDNRNRLTVIDDQLDPSQSIAYGYDSNGNQIQRTQTGTTLDFRYDVRDQLLEVDHDGSQAWTFSFDYRGLRVAKWGADGLINYTYDQSSVLQQHSALGEPVATYRYGPDRLLATDHHSQGLAFYHFDALGSIANLSDPTGNVQNRYQYDAWGNYRAQSGSQWNPFGFTGHEYDQETGLYYAKARFFDPEVGRFLTEDPAEPDLTSPPSLHRYLYAYGNPTYYTDPDGRETIDVTSDGEVYWVVEKNLPGPINPNTRRVLVGHVAMEKGLFGNKPAGEVQLLEDFGGGFRVPLSSLEKNASLFWGRDDAGNSVFNPSDISDMSPSIQNKIIAGWIDGELNPRREARLSAGSTYKERTREQMLGGGSADEATLLGVSGQLALGIVGADLPMDLRILKDDFQHMERSPEHLMKIIGDVVALAPVVGALKYSDEAVMALKNSDVTAKEAGRLLDAVGTPFRQLGRKQYSRLQKKIADRTITRDEWKRLQWHDRLVERRARGVSLFWEAEAERLTQGLPGTRNWSQEVRELIISGGRPKGIFGHHKYSVSQYPQLASDPNNIYPVTFYEHFFRWHGGKWGATHGGPVDPEFSEWF